VKTIIEDLAASERIVEINRSNPPKGMYVEINRSNPPKGMYELNAQHNLLPFQQKMQVQIESMIKAIQ